MKVRNIYPYEAIEEVEKGNKVYYVDKITCRVSNSEDVNVPSFIKAVRSKESNRYEFWVLEGTEATE